MDSGQGQQGNVLRDILKHVHHGDRIPALRGSPAKRILIGVLTLVPLFFIPWLVSIPIGVGATLLSKAVRIPWLGQLLLRLGQLVLYVLFGRLALNLVLGKGDLGFQGDQGLRDGLLGALFGVGSVVLIFLIMRGNGYLAVEGMAWEKLPPGEFVGVLVTALIANLAVGVMEEIPFRGYMVQVLTISPRKGVMVVLSGLIFSCWHLILNPMEGRSQLLWLALELIPAGLLLSWTFYRTGSLWLVIGLHAGYNFGQQALDVYGRYGNNPGWGNLTLLGSRVQGPSWLVGTPAGSAGLMQLLSKGLMIGLTLVYLHLFFRRRQAVFTKNNC